VNRQTPEREQVEAPVSPGGADTGKEPNTNRVNATVLIGAVCVFLLLTIMVRWCRKSTSRRMPSEALLAGTCQTRA
jgi:hypothetical protein